MSLRKLLLKPTGRWAISGATPLFIRGCIVLRLIPQKNYLVSRARRSSDYQIDIQDAEAFENAPQLQGIDTPERLLLNQEIIDTIKTAIDHLPEEMRTAIMLREFEGMSYEEIAVAMDCPVGTVRSRLFRAREAIDNKLNPLLEHGDL